MILRIHDICPRPPRKLVYPKPSRDYRETLKKCLRWEKSNKMTCCIAAICDNGNSIVLAADKMIGFRFVESQPDIQKAIQVHKDWWVMFAGDVSPVFDITDAIKLELRRKRGLGVEDLEEIANRCYEDVRIKKAIHRYLKRWGMEVEDFVKSGPKILGDRLFKKIKKKIVDFNLDMELIVAGFDRGGKAKIFSIDDGKPQRQDIPGFCAIGSGAVAADYIMTYRGDLHTKTPLRKAIYYVLEGKFFGETAQGVGTRTDMYILRKGLKALALDEDEIIEKKLVPLCERLEPGDMDKKPFVLRTLNELPLKGVPAIHPEKNRKRKAILKPKGTPVGNLTINFPIKLKKSPLRKT